MKTTEKDLTVLPVLNETSQPGWGGATDELAFDSGWLEE